MANSVDNHPLGLDQAFAFTCGVVAVYRDQHTWYKKRIGKPGVTVSPRLPNFDNPQFIARFYGYLAMGITQAYVDNCARNLELLVRCPTPSMVSPRELRQDHDGCQNQNGNPLDFVYM